MEDFGRNKVFKTLGASNHTDKERQELDYYATDPIAINKLATKFELPKNVVEICAGEGDLSERLKEFGCNVLSYDIVERSYKLDKVVDFLSLQELPKGYSVISNPPYKDASKIILHALEITKKGQWVCMFLKTTFLEGKARFKDLFSKYPPKMVLVCSERVLCAKNRDFEGMKAGGGSAISYSWYCWKIGDYESKPVIDWI